MAKNPTPLSIAEVYTCKEYSLLREFDALPIPLPIYRVYNDSLKVVRHGIFCYRPPACPSFVPVQKVERLKARVPAWKRLPMPGFASVKSVQNGIWIYIIATG